MIWLEIGYFEPRPFDFKTCDNYQFYNELKKATLNAKLYEDPINDFNKLLNGEVLVGFSQTLPDSNSLSLENFNFQLMSKTDFKNTLDQSLRYKNTAIS